MVADHAELGLEADARVEVVDAGDVEGHDAHAGAFLRSLGLLEVELGRVVPRLAGEGVGDAVDVVRALYVDKGHGFTGQDGELRRGEIVVGHHDGVVGFALAAEQRAGRDEDGSDQSAECRSHVYLGFGHALRLQCGSTTCDQVRMFCISGV